MRTCGMRTEKDSLGTKEVPEDAYYGIHTMRSLENFNLFGRPLPLEMVYAAVKLKLACCRANLELGNFDPKKAEAIEKAAARIINGEFDSQFCIDVFQAGSGTSSNMNINEVIANIACEELGAARGSKAVHPNDDINRGQSTNNIIPSSIRVAAHCGSKKLLNAADTLRRELVNKSKEFSDVIKSGRTHLQDAVPITVGQSFAAFARAVEKAACRVSSAGSRLLELGVGGNAVGTGLNTKPGFREKVIRHLNRITGEEYRAAKDGIEATQFLTDTAEFSGSLKLFAMDLLKIANDLRLLSSGPNTAIGELALPAVEPGSSIMPGKINPSICEAANMACMQVIGYDHAAALACAAGQLELNTHMPLVGHNVIHSIQILERCIVMLTQKCIKGITVNREVCARNFETSAGLPTVLNPILGYDRVAELVKESLAAKKSLKELVLEKGIMSAEEFGKLLGNCTRPNL